MSLSEVCPVSIQAIKSYIQLNTLNIPPSHPYHNIISLSQPHLPHNNTVFTAHRIHCYRGYWTVGMMLRNDAPLGGGFFPVYICFGFSYTSERKSPHL